MNTREEMISNAVTWIGDAVNNFQYQETSKMFNDMMSRQHRTLQQNFTRLCFMWIEYVASAEYRTDARNHDSQVISQDMLKSFGEFIAKKYGEHCNIKPSKWLGTV